MYIGLILVAWIVLGIALVAWTHVRTVPRGRAGYRRRQARQQAIVAPNRSRGYPSRAR
jgi:hypothetical protein